MPVRNRLPNRRAALTTDLHHEGSRFKVTVGFFPDGRPGEIFLNHDRADSLLDALAHDAAILASLAMQHGCSLQEITHALKRDTRGAAASPIGAAMDLLL